MFLKHILIKINETGQPNKKNHIRNMNIVTETKEISNKFLNKSAENCLFISERASVGRGA